MVKAIMRTGDWHLLKEFKENKKGRREALQGVYLGKEYAAATDGKRLVTIDIDKMTIPENTPAGSYSVIAAKKIDGTLTEVCFEKYDGEYPEIEKVMPKDNNCTKTIGIDKDTDKAIQEMILTSAAIQLFQITENAYNIHFIRPLAVLSTVWNVYCSGKDKPILLTADSNKVKIVLLPFRIDV